MRFLFRLIPFLSALATFLMFFGILLAPQMLAEIFGIYLIILIYGLFELLGRRIGDRDFWTVLVSVLCFVAAGLGFFIFLEGLVWQIFFALASAGVVGVFTEQWYRWFYANRDMPSYTLDVSLTILEIFSVFFAASSFIGLRIFMKSQIWILIPAFAFLIFALFMVTRQIHYTLRHLLLSGLIAAVLFSQIFFAVLFLPSGFVALGAIVAIAWYVFTGLLKVSELGAPLKKTVFRYAVLASVCFILTAATARWI